MTIGERLEGGERLVPDGGTGSEVQRRGVDVLQQVNKELKAWSAMANLSHADVVQQVHQDYLRVGADIITSNNFWTSPTRLATVGMQDRWREHAAAAVEVALRAREAAARERPDATAYLAGGIAPPALQDRATGDLASDVERLGKDAFQEEMAAHARLLAQCGVDCIWCEFLAYVDECVAAYDAAADHRPAGVHRGPRDQRRRQHAVRRVVHRPGGGAGRATGCRHPADVRQPGGDLGRPAAVACGVRRRHRRLPQPRLQPHGTGRQPPRAHHPSAQQRTGHPSDGGLLPVAHRRVRSRLARRGGADRRRLLRLRPRAHSRHSARRLRGLVGVHVAEGYLLYPKGHDAIGIGPFIRSR